MVTITGTTGDHVVDEDADGGMPTLANDIFALALSGPAASPQAARDGRDGIAPVMADSRVDGTNGDDVLHEFRGTVGEPGHVGIQSNDELFGYAGNDTFVMRRDSGAEFQTNSSNTDIVHGGAGTDTIRLVLDDNRVSLTLGDDPAGGHSGVLTEIIDGTASTTPGGGGGSLPQVPQYTDFDGIERFDIRFINGSGPFSGSFGLTLGSGDDVMRIERAGPATMNMGAGNDLVVVTTRLGWNADLRLDAGYDLLRFDSIGQNDTPSGLALSNTLSGSLTAGYSGSFTGNGTLRFAGVEDFDVEAGTIADTIVVGDGNDRVIALGGNDRVTAGAGVNVLDGGDGVDLLNVDLSSQASGVTIDLRRTGAQQTGGAGSITGFEGFFGTITGSAFADRLYDGPTDLGAVFNTGDGDDEVTVTGGTDTVNMGAGNDRLIVDYGVATNAVTVLSALSGSLAAGYSGGFYAIDNSGRVSFTGVENFTITSGSGNDSFATGDGNDVLSSGTGNDVVTAGGGANDVDGGAGTDALGIDLSGQTQGVTIDLLRTGAQQTGGAGSVTGFESFSGAVVGSSFADTLIEGAHAFNATFDTGAGNDLVQVSRGSDSVGMGLGNDRLVLDYTTAASNVAVLAALTGNLADGYSGGYYITDNTARTSFSGVENFTIFSGSGTDAFTTGDGNDILSTGAGNDVIQAGGGLNTVDGGEGIDALGIDLSIQAQGVTIDLLRSGAQQSGGAGSVAGFESFSGAVVGSSFADTLIEGAHAFNATFDTGAGNDLVQVSRGSDSVGMGLGNDRLVLDYTTATSNVAVLAALTGTVADGYSGGFYIIDNSARTSFTGVENFTIASGIGADRFVTGDGNDVLSGGDGNDAIFAGGGTNAVDGGAGTDSLGIDLSGQAQGVTIDLLWTGAQQSGGAGSVTGFESFSGTVVGSRFADMLIEGALAFDATFDTGRGNDLVQVSRGNDTVGMGIGNDRLVLDYATATSGVAALTSLTGTLATGYSGGFYITDNAARTSFSGVENFTISSGSASDAVTTGDGADVLSGGGGNDVLNAGGGNDTVEGGAGNDTLNGGAGLDTLTYANATAGVTVSLAITAAQDTLGAGTDTAAGFEYLTGSAFDDVLTGNAGNNLLTGGAGNDTLDGGVGNDRLVGGVGDDVYMVDTSGDRVFELADGGIDTVRSSVTLRLAAEIERLELVGDVAIDGIGNVSANTITGNAAANRIDGGQGNDVLLGLGGDDVLIGGSGADVLTGGAGDDFYVVDNVGDVVVERSGEGVDTVQSGVDYVLTDQVEKLILTGLARVGTGNALNNTIVGAARAETLSGLGGNDNIQGGAGTDTIAGGAGNDLIYGDGDRDVLTGGSGADRFAFRGGDTGATLTTADRIDDFSQADRDRILLNAIDANANTAGDDAFVFIGTAAFSGVAGQLRYEASATQTLIYGDMDGNGVADLAIRLLGSVTLVAGDFIL